MATEYKCDICGKPATFHITKIINGKKVEVHLCSECAEKASLDAMNLPLDLFPKLKELEEQIVSQKVAASDSCPNCGASLSEIEKGARFSCPNCYVALGNRLFELLAQMHGATEHKGKTPKTHAANCFASLDASKRLRNFEEVAGEELFEENLETALEDFVKGNPETVKLSAEEVSDVEEQPDNPNFAFSQYDDSEESLKKQLSAAISEERYEDAAKLRDKLNNISGSKQ